MKTRYKKLTYIFAGALACLFFAGTASAQRGNSHEAARGSGGGGNSQPAATSVNTSRPSSNSGFRPSGNSGFRPSGNSGFRPSGNSGFRPSGNSYHPANNGYRPSANSFNQSRNNIGVVQRGATSTQRTNYTYRNGQIVRANPGVRTGSGVTAYRNYGWPQRTAINGNATVGVRSYRNSPEIGYRGYWGGHHYYHYNRGYYSTYYAPRIGYTCTVLPYGYYPFYWGDYQYFYSGGLFYTYTDDQYTVVEPPIGAEIDELPSDVQSIVINGQQYYESNGVYYEPVTKDDGTMVYMVAGKDGQLNTDDQSVQDDQYQGPQLGDIVAQLPPDCKKLRINGEVLYVSPDGVYYQEQTDSDGDISYKIVGLPSDENGDGDGD